MGAQSSVLGNSSAELLRSAEKRLTILYHRILEVNDNVGLINNKQIGFLKGFRTADHLLVIDTIINEVVHKQKKKLFVALIY